MPPLQDGRKFEFVVSTPSHDASRQKQIQRLVRKHVMRPFTRRAPRLSTIILEDEALAEYIAQRQRQLPSGSATTSESPRATPAERYGFASTGSPSLAAVLLGASRPNPFGRYPINMSTKEYELVYHIWSSGQVIFQPFREYWFSLGMVDPAAMHLVIANAAMHRKALLGVHEEDVVELGHVEAAITSVNKRIGDSNQNVTDAMLGAVLGLMCHDFLDLRFDLCARHLDGFQTMIELRGGLLSIESATYIRLSLFWIELNICAAQDTIPRYPPPFHLIKNQYSTAHESYGLQHRDKAIGASGVFSLLSSTEMLDIFTELSFLTVALTAESPLRVSWDADNFPGFGFYPTLHKLLSIQLASTQDSFGSAVQEMCRLGAILFLAEVRRKFGISPVVTSVQSSKLHTLLDNNEMLWATELDTIRDWTILMAGCAADTEADRTRAVQSLIQSSIVLDYRSVDGLRNMASKMWWIDEVFLSKSQELQSEYINLLNR